MGFEGKVSSWFSHFVAQAKIMEGVNFWKIDEISVCKFRYLPSLLGGAILLRYPYICIYI